MLEVGGMGGAGGTQGSFISELGGRKRRAKGPETRPPGEVRMQGSCGATVFDCAGHSLLGPNKALSLTVRGTEARLCIYYA